MLNLSLYFICMTCCCPVGMFPFLSMMRRNAVVRVCKQDDVSSREDVWDACYSQSVVVPPKLFFRLIIGSSCLLRTDGFILSRGFFCCILPYLILNGKPNGGQLYLTRMNYVIRIGMIERIIGSYDNEYPVGSVYIYAMLKVKRFDSTDSQKRVPQHGRDVSGQGR